MEAIMLCLGFGLALVGLVAAAQAAQPDEDFWAPKLNLLTTKFVNSSADFQYAYQFGAGAVLISPPNTATIGSGFGSASQLPPIAKLQQETFWHHTYDGDSISLPRLFRVDFKVEPLNIALRPHSVLIEGKWFNVTFLPHAALIEKKQVKIILQPHSATMLWSKAF
jgi:hypothetical protein